MADNDYLVKWEIDIEAGSAEDAAKMAQEIQRNPNSIATVFDVIDSRTGEKTRVDIVINDPAIVAKTEIGQGVRGPTEEEADPE